MLEEFLLLLESEKEKVYEVLRPQIHKDILRYLTGGFFDKDQKRFVAFALMPVNKDYFWKYDYLLDFSGGHSAMLFDLPPEKQRPPGMYGLPEKSLKEYIEDKFYHYNLVSFYGEYDFNEWNILTSNCFTNTKKKTKMFENELSKLNGDIKDHFFNRSLFEETRQYYENQHSRLKKFREQREGLNSPYGDIEMKIPTADRPFVGHSQLVALIRLKKKREVNQTYIDYCQKAIFEPLSVKLKTFYPDEYNCIESFQPYPFSILFPEHKRYCICICLAINKSKKTRLQFFLYLQENGIMYEWTYFPPSTYKDHKISLHTLHEIFQPISQMDSFDYLINPECTLDDDDFWDNYVFKKEGSQYVYLKEIRFPD
ncbi:MAG TPA: hypothetical protein VGM63_16695 [Mucilaginibacter sp.]